MFRVLFRCFLMFALLLAVAHREQSAPANLGSHYEEGPSQRIEAVHKTPDRAAVDQAALVKRALRPQLSISAVRWHQVPALTLRRTCTARARKFRRAFHLARRRVPRLRDDDDDH